MNEAPSLSQDPTNAYKRRVWGNIAIALLLGACLFELWVMHRATPRFARLFEFLIASKADLPDVVRMAFSAARFQDRHIFALTVLAAATFTVLWLRRKTCWASWIASGLAMLLVAFSMIAWLAMA